MTKIYVGNLPMDIMERDLDEMFGRFGRLRYIELKIPARPPAFAFIEFDDYRDADDAVRSRHGANFEGSRLRVEHSGRDRYRGGGDRGGGDRGGGDRGGGGGYGGHDRDRHSSARGNGEFSNRRARTKFRVKVSGLPRGMSWQDLKDEMRKYGEVLYTDVDRDGYGIAEFSREDDMHYAVKKLDDTEIQGSRIRVQLEGNDSGGRDRARDRDRERSRSRDRRRDRDYDDDRRERDGDDDEARGDQREGDNEDDSRGGEGADENEDAPKNDDGAADTKMDEDDAKEAGEPKETAEDSGEGGGDEQGDGDAAANGGADDENVKAEGENDDE